MLNTLRDCGTLDLELREQAAALVRFALPSFYDSVDKVTLLRALADEFTEEGCELSKSLADVRNGIVTGVIASYPSSELRERQQGSLHHTLSRVPANEFAPFLKHLKTFSSNFPPLPISSHYLARLSVIPEAQGIGIGAQLLSVFLSNDTGGLGWSLHVASDNNRAIAFYRKHGFSIAGRIDLPYFTMHRRP